MKTKNTKTPIVLADDLLKERFRHVIIRSYRTKLREHVLASRTMFEEGRVSFRLAEAKAANVTLYVYMEFPGETYIREAGTVPVTALEKLVKAEIRHIAEAPVLVPDGYTLKR